MNGMDTSGHRRGHGGDMFAVAANVYINWAIYAVLGNLAGADAIAREHPTLLHAFARYLRSQFLVPAREVWRGVLVEPEQVVGGVLSAHPDFMFSSWSEDRDVARYFADPTTMVGDLLAKERPHAVGYITRCQPPLEDVLFHWTWGMPHRIAPLGLAHLALLHPEIGLKNAKQIAWNLLTQCEVILTTTKISELERSGPGTGLDGRFCPPWMKEGT
jgi:hypothetical protein